MARIRNGAGLAEPIVQRTFSALILSVTILGGLVAILSVTAAHHARPYAVAFAVAIAACCFLGVLAVVKKTFGIFLVQNAMVVLSVVFFVFAVGEWPSGDDGGKMAFIIFGGLTMLPAAGLAVILTIVILILRCVETMQKEKNTEAKEADGGDVA